MKYVPYQYEISENILKSLLLLANVPKVIF
jgi:hypothetical protein